MFVYVMFSFARLTCVFDVKGSRARWVEGVGKGS